MKKFNEYSTRFVLFKLGKADIEKLDPIDELRKRLSAMGGVWEKVTRVEVNEKGTLLTISFNSVENRDKFLLYVAKKEHGFPLQQVLQLSKDCEIIWNQYLVKLFPTTKGNPNHRASSKQPHSPATHKELEKFEVTRKHLIAWSRDTKVQIAAAEWEGRSLQLALPSP